MNSIPYKGCGGQDSHDPESIFKYLLFLSQGYIEDKITTTVEGIKENIENSLLSLFMSSKSCTSLDDLEKDLRREELTPTEHRVMVAILLDYYVSYTRFREDYTQIYSDRLYKYTDYYNKCLSFNIDSTVINHLIDILGNKYDFHSFSNERIMLLLGSRSALRIYGKIKQKFLQYGVCLNISCYNMAKIWNSHEGDVHSCETDNTSNAEKIKDTTTQNIDKLIYTYDTIYKDLIKQIKYLPIEQKETISRLINTILIDDKIDPSMIKYDISKTIKQYLQYKQTCQDIEMDQTVDNVQEKSSFNKLEKELDTYFDEPYEYFADYKEELKRGEAIRATKKVDNIVDSIKTDL